MDDDCKVPPVKRQKTISSFFGAPKPKEEAPAANVASTSQASSNDATKKSKDRIKEERRPDDFSPIIPKQVSIRASWRVHDECVLIRRVPDQPRSKVAAFDLDGTILQWRIPTFPSQLKHYELWNPSVPSKLRQLYDDGYKLVIFTNQGAIRSAFTGKKATMVKILIEWLAREIGRPLHALASTSKKAPHSHHKPSSNFWYTCETICNREQEFDIGSSFFVGDSVLTDDDPQGGVDEAFAQNVSTEEATLRFYTPQQYFGLPSSERRQTSGAMEAYTPVPRANVRAAQRSGYTTQPCLIILCGVQGSGKSTLAGQLPFPGVAQDTIRDGRPGTRQAVEAAVRKHLQQKQTVMVDRTHLDAEQRGHFIAIGKEYGVPIHVVVLIASKEEVARRVRARKNHQVMGESGVRLAMAALKKMVLPTYDEGVDLITICRKPEEVDRVRLEYTGEIGPIESITLSESVQLPSVVLGTMKLGKKVAASVVELALQSGIAGVDTAPTYQNEAQVGEGLNDACFCIVKVPKRAETAKQVRAELKQSLDHLGRKHADLLLLHWPSDKETLQTVWEAMEECIKDGLAKTLGVCNFNVGALRMLLGLATIRPTVNQVERTPWLPQWELTDFCASQSIHLQAHTPLGQGNNELLGHSVVTEIATETKLTAAEVLLLWNLQQGVPVVVKCGSEDHWNMAARIRTRPNLSSAHLQRLNEFPDSRRLVAPPFMYGKAIFHWAARFVKK